jgi:autotransporter-associated beta strand protein
MNNNNPVVVAPVALNGDVKIRCNNNSTTAGPLTLNGVISGTGDLTFDTATNTIAKAAVVLGAANNFTGNVKVTTGGSSISSIALRLAVANALPATTVVTLDGVTNGTSPNTVYTDLDLDGFDLTLAGLQNVNRVNRLQRVYSASTATLTVNNSADYTFGGNLGKTGGDEFGLTKSGAGKFTLSGVNTYTGATIVSGGMLAMGANNIMSSTAVSIGNATLDAATFANTVGTLGVTSTAKINLGTGAALAFADSSAEDWTGGTLDLTGTFVSGASLRFGDGTGTGLTSTQLGLISATGFSVFALDSNGYLTATPAGGYSSWQTANSTGQTIDLDHDNDGVANGVEYFLGGNSNTTGFTALPAVVNTAGTLSVTWTKAAVGYNGNYGSDFRVETSATLAAGSWTTETLGVAVTITGNAVKYTFPAGTKNFARLKVTGP